MSLIDLLNKVRAGSVDHRGNTDNEVNDALDNFHDSIRSTQKLKELADTEGMKMLVDDARDFLVKVDEIVSSEQIKHEDKRDAIAMKRAWTKVIQKLTGADSKLKVIEDQLEYMLNN